MTAPTPYTPTTAFNSFNPSAFPNMGTDLDNELENIATALTETQDNLGLIQRADGQLANEVVRRESLHEDVVLGVGTPSGWVTATDYAANDSVIYNAIWYWATSAHTSGTFATDLAAGLWTVIFDFTAVIGAALLSNTTPATLGTAATAGVATLASRADHIHTVLTGATPAAIVSSAGTVGVATLAARADHVHPYTAAIFDEGAAVLNAGVLAI